MTDPNPAGQVRPAITVAPVDAAGASADPAEDPIRARAGDQTGRQVGDQVGDPGSPPGVRAQLVAVVAAARRLLTAHIELARAEAGEIMSEVGRVAMLGGVAFGLVFLAGLLLPIGLALFLGEWIFGSIGWGVLLGSLLLVDGAVVAGLLAVGMPGRRLGLVALVALLIGGAIGIVLGLDLTNRAWTIIGDAVLPGVGAGTRPLAVAVLALGILGGIVGLVGRARAGGSAAGGLVGGAAAGILLGLLTAMAPGSRVGAAFGVLAMLIAWPALSGLDASRTGIDTEALKARFYPGQTIETTKETIEWVRQRTPHGRKS